MVLSGAVLDYLLNLLNETEPNFRINELVFLIKRLYRKLVQMVQLVQLMTAPRRCSNVTATELLIKLEEVGCQVSLDGDTLRVRGQLTDDLRQAIRQHKPALVTLLRERARMEAQARKAVKLLQERGWVAVKSRALGGEVVIWHNGKVAIPDKWQNAVTYTLDELRVLVDNPPGREELKAMHEAKKVFAGRLEAMPDG